METMWFSVYGIVWVIHFILFGMQRATLLISRSGGIEWRGGGEFLLPSWYPVTWLVIIGRWSILIAMAVLWSWKAALGLAIGSHILTVILPIPYRIYNGLFHHRISQLMKQDPNLALQLQETMETAKS